MGRSTLKYIGNRGFSADIFKWIFGLVAGAIILMFLVRFALQHVDISSKLTDLEYGEYIDDQLEAFRISGSGSKTLELAEGYTLNLDCDGFGINRNLKKSNKIIFGPRSLQGSLAIWTDSWEFPFKITNVYYIGDENLRLLIIYDDNFGGYAKNLQIPAIFNVQKTHIRDFSVDRLRRESGSERVNLIFFTAVTPAKDIISKLGNVHILQVKPGTYSVVYQNTGKETKYVGNEMLIGAMFAPENFDCLHAKAIERMRYVTDVYVRRADMLRLKTLEPECAQGLRDGKRALESLMDTDNVAALFSLRDQLEEQNRHLRRLDCAQIF